MECHKRSKYNLASPSLQKAGRVQAFISMLAKSLAFQRPPWPCSTQTFWMSSRRLAGVGVQALRSLAEWFESRNPDRQGTQLPRFCRLSGVSDRSLWSSKFWGSMVNAAILEHKLLKTEPFIDIIATASKEPDSNGLALRCLANCSPHVTLINVDLPRLWGSGVLWTNRGCCG